MFCFIRWRVTIQNMFTLVGLPVLFYSLESYYSKYVHTSRSTSFVLLVTEYY